MYSENNLSWFFGISISWKTINVTVLKCHWVFSKQSCTKKLLTVLCKRKYKHPYANENQSFFQQTEHSGPSTSNDIRIMRAAPSLPLQNRGAQCDDCAHVLKMKKQAQLYYNAASLKLKQASEMNKKKVLQAKKYYDCERLYYTASARKFDKTAKLDKKTLTKLSGKGKNGEKSGSKSQRGFEKTDEKQENRIAGKSLITLYFNSIACTGEFRIPL